MQTPPSTQRKCKRGFLQAYLEYTDQQESPELFHFWAAVSVLSMALGRKCSIKRGFYNCYPNQYIIIVSESARCRKTVSADIAVSLYRAANIGGVFQGKLTTRSLSQYLATQTIQTGTGACFIYSPELGRLLGADSYTSGLMVAITDYYGCPAEDEVLTATQGVDKPKNIFINILGCTVPQWLSSMPSDMVEGGFSSRTLFIVQNTPRKPNPRPIITAQLTQLYVDLIHDLQTIALIEGDYVLTESAEVYYDTWYSAAYTHIDEQDPRLRAYFARKGEHVLKLAMCLSASESSKLVIEHWHIQNALTFLKQAELYMPTAFRGVSFSDSTKHMDRILNQIREGGGHVDRATLLRKNRFYLDTIELERIIETLAASNLLRRELKSGRWHYYLLE